MIKPDKELRDAFFALDAADAWLTLGAANYVIGSLSALKRFLLHFKGIGGDERGGIQQLEIAATRGRYGARRGVSGESSFFRELAKLDASPDAAVPL